MRSDIFHRLGRDIESERQRRRLRQRDLADRIGRPPARVSELVRDLETGRSGKDRLTLLADICDALDLVPILVRRDQLSDMDAALSPHPAIKPSNLPRAPSVFDEVFVDLGADDPEAEPHG